MLQQFVRKLSLLPGQRRVEERERDLVHRIVCVVRRSVRLREIHAVSRHVCACLFRELDQLAADMGLTEEQVKDAGREYRVGRFPFQASGRAISLGETEGLVKVIADARTDRLLGVHFFGPRASELIAEAVMALEFAGSAEDIARICHAHPTLSEALADAARAAYSGQPINLYQPRSL